MNDYWRIPSKTDADFVASMEDILDVYELPYNPRALLSAWMKSHTSC